METIKNYLESMFLGLPNTPEVQKAKFELGNMMEDKYAELINEGKTNNEAIGIVISEFGNLEELSFDLGIDNFMREGNPEVGRQITLSEAKDYLREKGNQSMMIAVGVMLCIMSVIGPIMTSSFFNPIGDSVGVAIMFIMIAAAVGLFVLSGIYINKWEYFKKETCHTDFETTSYVHEKNEEFRVTYGLMLTIGIILCVLSFIPVIILDNVGVFYKQSILFSNLGATSLFVMVGIGVFLIVAAGVKKSGYTNLLNINEKETVGGNYVPNQGKGKLNNKTVESIMSVYWPTVTCIYFIWSFLTYDWGITWIIWLVAGVVEKMIRNAFSDK